MEDNKTLCRSLSAAQRSSASGQAVAGYAPSECELTEMQLVKFILNKRLYVCALAFTSIPVVFFFFLCHSPLTL